MALSLYWPDKYIENRKKELTTTKDDSSSNIAVWISLGVVLMIVMFIGVNNEIQFKSTTESFISKIILINGL